ncbi:hypothetical protein [Alkalilacustris brevis]|uniref:hypothetical protein n=1 Tax=Alkalilacustris brevis TaxID=2026338 RepID=UPI000E0CC512|nr:hypothetical protein [Alkalilacustris brevis]
MLTRVLGALARAFLVFLLVTMPALMMPGIATETAQIVLLFAFFAALLTVIEYSARYPGLIEFRYAPPYNRIRFLALFLIVLMLSAIARAQHEPGTLTLFVQAVGTLIGQSMDFPYSPVRLVTLMLPASSSAEHVLLVRSAAGISYFVSLFMLIVFVCSLRIGGWPARHNAFNVWVNLPTFDPTAGGDVVLRLERDAMLNIALGFFLPFLIPALILTVSVTVRPVTLTDPQTLVWTVAAWAFLPATLLMRGVALSRIARMIREKRRRNGDTEGAALQPV